MNEKRKVQKCGDCDPRSQAFHCCRILAFTALIFYLVFIFSPLIKIVFFLPVSNSELIHAKVHVKSLLSHRLVHSERKGWMRKSWDKAGKVSLLRLNDSPCGREKMCVTRVTKFPFNEHFFSSSPSIRQDATLSPAGKPELIQIASASGRRWEVPSRKKEND